MLMKLRLVFSPVLIRKIIIILLAMLIASITTSFSFGIKKAHGGDTEAFLARRDAQRLEKLEAIIKEITFVIEDKSVDKGVLKAKLESYKTEDPSFVSDLEDAIQAIGHNNKSILESFLRKALPKKEELKKSAPASSTTEVTCAKAEKLENEIGELKDIIESLKEQIEKNEKKFAKEKDSLETLILQLTARAEIASELVNVDPQQLLQRYNVERAKMIALVQERASFKAAIEELNDRIERLEDKEELDEDDQEKLEKYKEKKEKFEKRKSELEKGALRSQILIQEIEKKLKETIAASMVQTGRGVRIDPQTGLPIPGQEAMQPNLPPLGNPRDEAIRTAILGLYNNSQQQVPGGNPSAPTIQQQTSPASPQPTPAPIPGGVSTGRGSRGISAGGPQDNSLRALIDYANGM